MPAFNFQKRFAPAVEAGEKRQTIRAPRKDGRPHCRRGDTIRLYTGMRTKSCRLICEATVTAVQTVSIEATSMTLDGRPLYGSLQYRDQSDPTDNEFAQADGFADFMEMSAWFDDVHGLPFTGTLIKWEPIA